MDQLESELQEAAEDFLTQLRMKLKLDLAAAARFKAPLRAAAVAWADTPTISKSAASLFVDLETATLSCAHLFKGEQQEAVKYLADELGGLVRKCVAEPSGSGRLP